MDDAARVAAVLAELRGREPIFHRLELGTSREDFEAGTAADFWEVGASGRVYSREVVWATLAERCADPGYAATDAWVTSDFACREIAVEPALLVEQPSGQVGDSGEEHPRRAGELDGVLHRV